MKRGIVFLFLIGVLCANSTISYGASMGNTAGVMSVIQRSQSSSISISKNTATISTCATGKSGTDNIEIVCKLQRYSSGKWTNEKQWTYSKASRMVILKKEYALEKKGKYRVKSVVTYHDGTSTETKTTYSATKSYS